MVIGRRGDEARGQDHRILGVAVMDLFVQAKQKHYFFVFEMPPGGLRPSQHAPMACPLACRVQPWHALPKKEVIFVVEIASYTLERGLRQG